MKTNGKLANLKKGRDYVELSTGVYFTIAAIAQIHGCAETTVRKKASIHKIDREEVVGTIFYKDDKVFDLVAKEDRAHHLEPAKPYAALSHQVDSMEQTVQRSANVVAEMHGMLSDMTDYMKTMNSNLEMLLDHMTKDKTLSTVVQLKATGSEDGY